jgi:hypothetical protein
MQTPEEVQIAIDEHRWTLGDTIRIMHVGCSDGKDAAMSITRAANGWLYHCFRCQSTSGFVSADRCSPKDVLRQWDTIQTATTYKAMAVSQLPNDMIMLSPTEILPNVPAEVYIWLWKFHFKLDTMAKYGLGWSPSYKRLIVPIYDTILLSGGDRATKLLGWLGRDVVERTKTERRELKIPKWHTQRDKTTKYFYYHLMSESNNLVIVEDVISAIRAHEATGFNTLALNTTFLPTHIIVRLRPYNTFLWLDGNMLQTKVTYASKCSSLGVHVKVIHTTRDPKEYNSKMIVAILEGKQIDY